MSQPGGPIPSWDGAVPSRYVLKEGEYRKSPVYVLSLYRALLREASYLPDEMARKFFHNHIVEGFRAHRAPKYLRGSHPGDSRQSRALGDTRVTKHIADARKGLRLLVDANHGSPTHLRKVFEMSYGRRGKRRYELMEDLMPKNPVPVDESAVQELANALELIRASPAIKEPRLTEKMLALIKSQRGQKDRLFSKPNIKSTKPVVPETNAWGRPLPRSRAKNIIKKWYRETLERLMLPLPKQEWQRLGDLAMGKEPWEGFPKRRARAIENLEPGVSSPPDPQHNGYNITQRYMRRMWKVIFQQCPLMEWDDTRSRWVVTWGRVNGETEDLALRGNAKLDDSAFVGVDDSGRIDSS